MTTMLRRRVLFTDDHEAFRDSVRSFLDVNVIADLDEWRREGSLPTGVLRAAGDAGFLGVNVADGYGGAGLDDLGFLAVLIEETLNVGGTGLALLWALQAGVAAPAIAAAGSQDAAQRWLPGLAAGHVVAVTARGGVVDGDRISAVLPNIPFGRLADLLLVTVPSGPRAGETILVPTRQDGVVVAAVDGNLAAPEAGFADVTIDGVRVEDADVLNAESALTRRYHLWFAVLAAAAARTAYRLGDDYSRTRRVFGRPLREFDNTRLRMAELSAGIATTTAFVDACLAEPNAVDDATVIIAHHAAAQLHDASVDQALQLHGGYGYMREYPVSQAFADARFLRTLARQYECAPNRALADALAG